MMPVAILAGGLGSRLGALTEDRPKSLVMVAGTPFIWHQLALLHSAGIDQVYVLGSHMVLQLQRELSHASSDDFTVEVVEDDPPLAGTAGALRPLANRLKKPFFVLYGDSFLNCDYAMVEERFRRSRAVAMMVVCLTPPEALPNAYLDHGYVRHYSKTRLVSTMRHIDYGLSVMTPASLNQYPLVKDLSLLQEALSLDGALAGMEWPERYYTIGSPHGLALTEAAILSRMDHANK